MEQRLSLITLRVADLNRVRAFYDWLGSRSGASPADDVVFFQAGSMIVALWGGVTFAYNAASPGDGDAVVDEARQAGATISREPAATSWGGYSRVFVDRDGHPWEVAHTPGWRLDADGSIHLSEGDPAKP